MTNVLILGGTGWLSGRIARRWLDAGAAVTCLARGTRSVPDGAVLVQGDRDRADAYADIAGGWDVVVDISSRASHVGDAVDVLGERAARWVFISSMSVYADDATVGADESAPLHAPARPGDEYDYAAEKVAAEDHVRRLGDRALIVRPGLIVGDGDPSDRFGYWAAAFARAGDGPVLVPPRAARNCQVIDVDDLAAFLVETSLTGVVDAIGDRHPLDEVLAGIREAAGHTGSVVEAAEPWLLDHGVEYWAGERSLPLWLPAEMAGFMARSNAAYLRSGGTLRPITETIASVLADERARGIDRERRAGLTRPDELALLDALA
ncbi:NAD-dependent epimerase/dehydratase family protein [Microbacterium sp.]|uniref:NAD-dependent epimerase/dehydratase family protein n=1 Tax=Microbacterium sp. TaxID=51671 RepID=UPI002FDF7516